MDWKLLSSRKPQWLFFFLLLVWFAGAGMPSAQAQVYESAQNGYTIETLGTHSLSTMTTALDQGNWDSYRRVTLPVILTFDDGSVVRLHSASSRPQPQIGIAVPDQAPVVDRTFSITPGGHILMLCNTQISK